MKTFLIFTDRRGRHRICGRALQILFGIVEVDRRYFWDYDKLCRRFNRRRRRF